MFRKNMKIFNFHDFEGIYESTLTNRSETTFLKGVLGPI